VHDSKAMQRQKKLYKKMKKWSKESNKKILLTIYQHLSQANATSCEGNANFFFSFFKIFRETKLFHSKKLQVLKNKLRHKKCHSDGGRKEK